MLFRSPRYYFFLFRRHVATNGEEHLELHAVYVLAVGTGGNQVFLAFSTVSDLMNLPRAYNSGWNTQVAMDATYGVCNKALGVIQIGVNSLGAKLRPIVYSVITGSETAEYYANSWDGAVRALLLLQRSFVPCADAACDTCADITACFAHQKTVEIFSRPDVQSEQRLPVDIASADNSNAIHNFIRTELGA